MLFSLFQGKKLEVWNANSNMVFPKLYVKKQQKQTNKKQYFLISRKKGILRPWLILFQDYHKSINWLYVDAALNFKGQRTGILVDTFRFALFVSLG